MFAGKSILEIVMIGGFTMYILLFCSLISIAIFLERLMYYRKLSKMALAGYYSNREMRKTWQIRFDIYGIIPIFAEKWEKREKKKCFGNIPLKNIMKDC